MQEGKIQKIEVLVGSGAPVIRTSIETMLRNEGFVAELNKNPQDYREIIKKVREYGDGCLAVVTSLNYSEKFDKNGIEVVKGIREFNKELPIYVYTMTIDEKVIADARKYGATKVTNTLTEIVNLLKELRKK